MRFTTTWLYECEQIMKLLRFDFLICGMKMIPATYIVIKGLRGIMHTKQSEWAPIRKVTNANGVLATSWDLF